MEEECRDHSDSQTRRRILRSRQHSRQSELYTNCGNMCCSMSTPTRLVCDIGIVGIKSTFRLEIFGFYFSMCREESTSQHNSHFKIEDYLLVFCHIKKHICIDIYTIYNSKTVFPNSSYQHRRKYLFLRKYFISMTNMFFTASVCVCVIRGRDWLISFQRIFSFIAQG